MATFNNPVIRGFNPDPSICRVGEDYYIAVSSFEYFPGVPLFHSRDLVNWRLIGHALNRAGQLDLRGQAASEGIFAPTLRYHDGTFYLITTNVGGIGNFIVTARDPAGPWSDPVLIDKGCFDPSLFFDDDGKVYYTRRDKGAIAQAEIDINSGKLLTELALLARPFSSSDAEGPHLYKRNGWYYLLCAEGGTGYGHMITVGRSRHPGGPFETCPHNPILTHRHLVPHAIRYTGHGDLVEAQDGSWWIVFLGTRHDPQFGYNFHVMGRETFLAPVEWRNDWPVVNGGHPIELIMPMPALSPHSWGCENADSALVDGQLAPQWSTLRAPLPPTHLFPLPCGGIALRGNASAIGDRATPAFIARRQEDFHFSLAATLRFAPQRDGEEAGFALRQSDTFYISLVIKRESGSCWLTVCRRILDMEQVMARVPYDSPQCFLEIRGDYTHYTLRAGSAPDDQQTLDRCPLRFLSTELATGWTGVVMGPYTSGNGEECDAVAEFSDICYKAL